MFVEQNNKTMETNKSVEIIDSMLKLVRKSYHRVAFYFILWGTLMGAAGLGEFLY